jgi:DNA-binding MarR family transcriptional regulator
MATKAARADQVFTEFRRVIANVVLYNDHVAQQTGLSASESQFMHLLALNGDMSPSQLAQQSGLTSGTVTGVLDRLEKLGFVRRENHPSDRRKVVVVLDEAAVRSAMEPFYADQGRALAAVIDRFTTAELETILRFLVLLTERSDTDG